jgi:RNA polymerase sigma factor (sigma-70 family)
MADDGALIREYSQSGSEEAFAELVSRHLDLVYSTALRSLRGDEHLARDICQTVFIDLARKASRLANRSELAGWLYTSTCFAAAKAVRSQRRRLVREQAAEVVRHDFAETSQATDWDRIRPVLDSLMLDLKEADRQALLVRFFQRCSLAEVGTKLGLTEKAARMRVERALEKLRGLLARRGITSTGAALALVLAQQAVIAAPTGLGTAITATSLAIATTTGSLSIVNLITLMKTKTIVLGILVVAGAGTSFVLQHQTNAQLQEQIAGLRAQLAQAPSVQPSNEAIDKSELEQLRRDNAELVRLRGEVTDLRRQVTASAKDQKEADERVRATKMVSEQEAGKDLLAKSPEIPMVPANRWANVGFASPAAALETLNWSVANHDTNAFSNALMWDAQAKARAEALFANAPETVRQRFGTVDEVIFDWWLNNSTPIAAARVLSQIDEGSNEASLVEQHIYNDGRVRENSVQFERDNNGQWRRVIPPELMPKLEVVLNNIALVPSAVGGK